MTVAIDQAKLKKNNNNNSWRDSQQPNSSKYGDEARNFSPNNKGRTGEEKPFSMDGDKITQLKKEIEYNRNYMLKTSHEDEKEKCRKIIARLEKELKNLTENSSNSDSNNSNNYGSSGD